MSDEETQGLAARIQASAGVLSEQAIPILGQGHNFPERRALRPMPVNLFKELDVVRQDVAAEILAKAGVLSQPAPPPLPELGDSKKRGTLRPMPVSLIDAGVGSHAFETHQQLDEPMSNEATQGAPRIQATAGVLSESALRLLSEQGHVEEPGTLRAGPDTILEVAGLPKPGAAAGSRDGIGSQLLSAFTDGAFRGGAASVALVGSSYFDIAPAEVSIPVHVGSGIGMLSGIFAARNSPGTSMLAHGAGGVVGGAMIVLLAANAVNKLRSNKIRKKSKSLLEQMNEKFEKNKRTRGALEKFLTGNNLNAIVKRKDHRENTDLWTFIEQTANIPKGHAEGYTLRKVSNSVYGLTPQDDIQKRHEEIQLNNNFLKKNSGIKEALDKQLCPKIAELALDKNLQNAIVYFPDYPGESYICSAVAGDKKNIHIPQETIGLLKNARPRFALGIAVRPFDLRVGNFCKEMVGVGDVTSFQPSTLQYQFNDQLDPGILNTLREAYVDTRRAMLPPKMRWAYSSFLPVASVPPSSDGMEDYVDEIFQDKKGKKTQGEKISLLQALYNNDKRILSDIDVRYRHASYRNVIPNIFRNAPNISPTEMDKRFLERILRNVNSRENIANNHKSPEVPGSYMGAIIGLTAEPNIADYAEEAINLAQLKAASIEDFKSLGPSNGITINPRGKIKLSFKDNSEIKMVQGNGEWTIAGKDAAWKFSLNRLQDHLIGRACILLSCNDNSANTSSKESSSDGPKIIYGEKKIRSFYFPLEYYISLQEAMQNKNIFEISVDAKKTARVDAIHKQPMQIPDRTATRPSPSRSSLLNLLASVTPTAGTTSGRDAASSSRSPR